MREPDSVPISRSFELFPCECLTRTRWIVISTERFLFFFGRLAAVFNFIRPCAVLALPAVLIEVIKIESVVVKVRTILVNEVLIEPRDQA